MTEELEQAKTDYDFLTQITSTVVMHPIYIQVCIASH